MDRNIMTSWKTETKRMCDLAVPTIIVFLGLFTPQALTAAFIGRKLGVQYLDGFSLANLMSNLLAFSVLKGLFLANDTLMPQAFGAGNYKEVGLLAIRGYIVGLLFMMPIFVVLFLYMHPILLFLGQSPLPASLAAQFFRVYVLVFPFYILYVMMWKFLTAQEIMRPLMVVQLIACGMILPLTLTCFVEWYGYIGGAWALVVYNVAQAVLLLGYILTTSPSHLEWIIIKLAIRIIVGGCESVSGFGCGWYPVIGRVVVLGGVDSGGGYVWSDCSECAHDCGASDHGCGDGDVGNSERVGGSYGGNHAAQRISCKADNDLDVHCPLASRLGYHINDVGVSIRHLFLVHKRSPRC